MERITIFILCGGKSSRMQSEKGLVLFQSKPLIEHVIEAVLPLNGKIKLVTNSSEYGYLPFEIINDIELEKGPIGGICSALMNSDTEINMILSCDIPLITNNLLAELLEQHKMEFDATVFSDQNKIHPLIGIYSKKIIPVLKEAIEEDHLKMMHLLGNLKHQIISAEAEQSIHFRNVNSVAELNELNNDLK